MLKNESIICFAGEDWWYHHPHSKNHLMRRFARAGNRVMFVNSISMGLPSMRSPDFFNKIRRKLRSYAKMVRRTEEGIIVVSPIVTPFYSSPLGRALNRVLLVAQVRLLMLVFGMKRPVLWVAIPTAREVVGRLGERALIYQVSDKYDANRMDHATSGGVIADMHDDMLARATLVYYSGRKLFEEDVVAHPEIEAKAKMLQQAVDYEHFASATSREWQAPVELEATSSPRLGYFGAIETWLLDQELIRYVSGRRPEWQWVLLGLKSARLDIEDLPNVHYLGSKPYSEMPRYAAAFDVCVLPWVTDNEFVSYGSAIKVREYLATGKPVVITPLYEYESLDGILRISRGYDDFILKVEDALSRDSDEKRRARQEAVRGSTWDARSEEVSREIERLLLEYPLDDYRSR
ncbi:MAG TPA: glycosyltransferase [Blastocatellia bacterium]|jgi:glycosyltransferase involved in cell wall biosynthesis|nr:glycosyltransferase [Blastocatellia bacterium]